MGVELTRLVQDSFEGTDELAAVDAVAHRLHQHLATPEVELLVAAANMPGVSSAAVQSTFLDFARELGFRDESTGLFVGYDTAALRPDYFMPLTGTGTGILMEVERGKTTINNMDLLDFWKCHLCERANYLFLLVPRQLVQKPGGPARNEYQTVVRRLRSFFVPRNYTNVRGAYVFGY